ncbi:MAG: hypothetical protein AMJ70_00305 [Dehalococcoidia bacterium SG8_51_3]|nr:MAG: hypothetical protein AMJ70_00305 [Dehalococcoidia bacterium SG8_51_3]
MRTVTFISSLVLIFIIPWEGVIQLPSLGNATKAIGFGVAALWLAAIIITGRLRKPGLFHFVVALFVVWNAFTVFWSADPGRTAAHVLTLAQLLILSLILWDLYTSRAALLIGLQAYVLGAYVAVGGAVYNFFTGNDFYTYYERFSPGETNPDGFGFLVVLGIPLAWYLASSESTSKISGLLKLVNYAYIPTAFLGLALSGTRTALIAAIPAMAFGIVSLSRLRLAVRITIFVLLTSSILILLPQVQTLRSFQRFSTTATELAEGSLNQRTFLWRDGLDSFEENPLFGVGSNMYRSVNSLGKVAHNSYLSVLVESGLVGFILFGVILTMVVLQAWSQPKWDRRFWLTVLLVWAIGASTLTWEHRKTTWLFFSFVIASAALASHQVETSPLLQRTKFEVKSFGRLR